MSMPHMKRNSERNFYVEFLALTKRVEQLEEIINKLTEKLKESKE